MRQAERNLAASVTARLLGRAKETGDDFETLLTSFRFERFLHRLGESAVTWRMGPKTSISGNSSRSSWKAIGAT